MSLVIVDMEERGTYNRIIGKNRNKQVRGGHDENG
jgi:hypothetical protein